MWKKITMKYGDGDPGNTMLRRHDEEFEGDIEHAKTMIALQDTSFKHVQAMYLQDLDEKPDGDVYIYEVGVTHTGGLEFTPWAFHGQKFDRIAPDTQAKAALNLAAMTDRTGTVGRNIVEVLKELNKA